MMNVKISQKHANMHCIRKNDTLTYVIEMKASMTRYQVSNLI